MNHDHARPAGASRRPRSVLVRTLAVAAAALGATLAAGGMSQETRVYDGRGSEPGPSPTLGAKPPLGSETVVLFDGRAWKGWRTRDGKPSAWQAPGDGTGVAGGGDAITARQLGDHQLHVEFMCPPMPEKEGQARSNSGVYVHGRYEVQVLDTFGQDPFPGGCGGLYSIAPPLVNAARPAGAWQTYDIIFRAPRFGEDGAVTENPRITVVHNGIVIHNNLELPSTTPGGLDGEMVKTGPLLLQDHGDPVRYRNIWVRDLGGTK